MLLEAAQIQKSYGAKVVLTNASLRVGYGERVALVGRNGCGKTSLLRILLGEIEPDKGTVIRHRGCRIGVLRQNVEESPLHLTVRAAASMARSEQMQTKARLSELEAQMSAGESVDLEEYANLHERLLETGAYDAEREIDSVLSRLGFTHDDMGRPIAQLSGGQRTRLLLGTLLLEQPDLLILDEPTNHLDIEAVEWLENWLVQHRIAAVIVSHDRDFLQNTADRIVELENGKTREWPGPFDHFLRLREEDRQRAARIARTEAAKAAKLDEFVRRFMNSERTAQAKGRLRLLNRLNANRMNVPTDQRSMSVGFGSPTRSGDIVIRCEKLSVSFDSQVVFHDLDWIVMRGERWGVVGPNGCGKSTLLRALVQELAPTNGLARLGSKVQVGYFSQDLDLFELTDTPMDVLCGDLGMEIQPARNLLGRLLITGDQAFQTIGSMSGGERNKLALACLTAMNPNLLILDEPTNHLDFDSRQALINVLAEFKGTLVVASHDRWLLREVTNRTLEFGAFGILKKLEGYSRPIADGGNQEQVVNAKKRSTKSSGGRPVQFAWREPMSAHELSKSIVRKRTELERAESRVHALEAEIAHLEAQLATPPDDASLFELTLRHKDLVTSLGQAFEAWETVGTELDELEKLQNSRQR
ncbi:ABC-F family ATP-binding cassette domain-containing protein [Fimbriimonadia bacterium ATM]|nr:MAG: ABC transporter ATP-binding protein [Armatimonadota bacterium]MBC6968615.1 ABC transporter ATP-binding protein [Armatimonadota bacterium]MCE7898546.1 ABC transporter ATP-binding protein [Armatimonadetes bacterium ATM1]MDL1928161.1 ABC-F family ATP-binding cassette domain-containing protein [Fimbriimonadia bacterium ATM]RIJ98274.1 MAG: hypothetical protein DCC45_00450 [Armatimonadota bacterium]